jgi:hypothetical protein
MKRLVLLLVAFLMLATTSFSQTEANSETIRLKYIIPSDMIKMLSPYTIPADLFELLKPQRAWDRATLFPNDIEYLWPDDSKNTLKIIGPKEAIAEVKQKVKELDALPQQLLIQVRLLRASITKEGIGTVEVVAQPIVSVMNNKLGYINTAEIFAPAGFIVIVAPRINDDGTVALPLAIARTKTTKRMIPLTPPYQGYGPISFNAEGGAHTVVHDRESEGIFQKELRISQKKIVRIFGITDSLDPKVQEAVKNWR